MLISFLLLSLARLLHGAPTIAAATEGNPDILPGVDLLPPHGIAFGTRSKSDIIISCSATIFACTWTAIHPNITSPADSRFNIFKGRLITTFYALLVPEFIILWALRQYWCAKIIADEYNRDIAKQAINQHNSYQAGLLVCITKWSSILVYGYSIVGNENQNSSKLSIFQKLRSCGSEIWCNIKEWLFDPPPFYPVGEGQIRPWTITHGFFVQMGGFMLCKNGRPIQTLSFEAIKDKINDNTIEPPKISEAEIADRSKGDIISKTVVILQTTWFILQCISRWSTGIPLTELEALTFGFAMLNGVTYALWWNKPQNVGVPVYLEMKACQPAPSQSEIGSVIELPQMNAVDHEFETTAPSNNHVRAKKPLEPMQFTEEQRNKISFAVDTLRKWNGMPWPKSYIGIFVRIFATIFFLFPVLLMATIYHGFGKLLGVVSQGPPASGDLSVSIFWSEDKEKSFQGPQFNTYLILFYPILFGMVNIFQSLSFADSSYARLCSLFALLNTFGPYYSVICLELATYPLEYCWPGITKTTRVLVIIPLATSIYLVTRLILIILSLLSLRTLPQNAYLTIDWLSSIPHF